MTSPAPDSTSSNKDGQLFQQLDEYPWGSDEEFQSGLQAILGPKPTAEQAEQLALRARCFYYSRKFSTSIDFAAYSDWRSQHPVPPSPESTATELAAGQSATTSHSPNLHDGKDNLDVSANSPGSYPLTFNHIVDLITSGQPVPGIKEIPDTLLEGQSSETKKEQRKKPWEKERQDNHPSIEGAAPENEAG